MTYLTGPALKNTISWRAPSHGINRVNVGYRYIDSRGRAAPEYEAVRIRVHAYYVSSATPLEPLEQFLRDLPGCVDTERYRHGTRSRLRPRDTNLRSQVIAIFDRLPTQL